MQLKGDSRALCKPIAIIATYPAVIHEAVRGADCVSVVTASPPRGGRERSKPTGWDRTRLSVLLPLGVVVAVAIVCIVVAALTSAQRADDVALERERQLLTRAIDNHAEWSLLRLRNTARSSASVSADDINQSPAVVQPRLRSWLGTLIDH